MLLATLVASTMAAPNRKIVRGLTDTLELDGSPAKGKDSEVKKPEHDDKATDKPKYKHDDEIIPGYGCPEGTFLSCCESGVPVSSALGLATTGCDAALDTEEGGGNGVTTGTCDDGLYATCCTTAVDVSFVMIV